MEKIEVNDNIEQEPDREQEQEQEIENENEKSRLSGIDVIEYYNKKGETNSNHCTKIILVIILAIFILCLIFFISLKTVDIIYEDRSNIDNAKLKSNLNKNIFEESKNQNLNVNNAQNPIINNIEGKEKNYTKNDLNNTQTQNFTKENIINETQTQNYTKENIINNTQSQNYTKENIINEIQTLNYILNDTQTQNYTKENITNDTQSQNCTKNEINETQTQNYTKENIINYTQSQNNVINEINDTQNQNFTKKEVNETQSQNFTVNDLNNTQSQNYTKEGLKDIDIIPPVDEDINKTKIEERLINNDTLYNISNNATVNSYNYTDDNNKNNTTRKIVLAFAYSTLYSNGIARFITLTSKYFMETGKYDICFITGKPYSKEYSFDPKIKRFIAYDNYTLIKKIIRSEHIDIVILQNVLSNSAADFYKKLGVKVVCIFHGIYMSAMFHGNTNSYRNWYKFDSFDSFVFIASDDYYFYNNLGFKNGIFIPNLYTFEPSQTQNSNLTYNNIIMLGRLNDEIKGAKYAVMAMSYIVKEVPDARLNLVTSDSRIQFLKNLTNELNLTNNVFIQYHTYNISQLFWNSSVHMYTSLTEAFPMAMNEGKAHGLPIVAFGVPFSNPYQDGVINVDLLDIKALANETIKLLKDYDYRKKMGEYAKKSLEMFSNNETVYLWERLFRSLLSEDKNEYRELQKEIESKYYNQEKAKEHVEKHYQSLLRYNNTFSCHSLDDFIDPEKVKNIKECEIPKSSNETQIPNVTKIINN